MCKGSKGERYEGVSKRGTLKLSYTGTQVSRALTACGFEPSRPVRCSPSRLEAGTGEAVLFSFTFQPGFISLFYPQVFSKVFKWAHLWLATWCLLWTHIRSPRTYWKFPITCVPPQTVDHTNWWSISGQILLLHSRSVMVQCSCRGTIACGAGQFFRGSWNMKWFWSHPLDAAASRSHYGNHTTPSGGTGSQHSLSTGDDRVVFRVRPASLILSILVTFSPTLSKNWGELSLLLKVIGYSSDKRGELPPLSTVCQRSQSKRWTLNKGIERAPGNLGLAEFPSLPKHLFAQTSPPTAGLQVPTGHGLHYQQMLILPLGSQDMKSQSRNMWWLLLIMEE